VTGSGNGPAAGLAAGADHDARAALDAERVLARARIRSMRKEFDEIVEASAGSNADDEHDPEGATIAFERARVAAMLKEAQAALDDLDRAADRLLVGTYGACEHCGEVIAPERLEALPATRTCVRCAGLVG
jgi:DnaK suppressor protein